MKEGKRRGTNNLDQEPISGVEGNVGGTRILINKRQVDHGNLHPGGTNKGKGKARAKRKLTGKTEVSMTEQ